MNIRHGASLVLLAAGTILFAPATNLIAQTHRARVCSQRFQGPCSAWDEQTEAPSLANPLTASVHDLLSGPGSTCAWPPSGMSVELDATTQVSRFGHIEATKDTLICAAFGTEAGTNAVAYYYLDNGQFVFTRTDQPASPGETVQIRLNTEFQATIDPIMIPTNPLTGNEWSQFFTVGLWYGGNGLGNAGSYGPPALNLLDVGLPAPVDTGWSPGPPTSYLTVPLGTPVSMDMEMTVSMDEAYDTCASCQGVGRYDSISTMRLRLAPQPFAFSGPGTYSASAPSLLIHSNIYPVVTIIDQNTTQQDLDDLTTVDGNIIVDRAPNIGCLSFTNMTEVTGSIIVQGGPPYPVCMELIEALVSGNYYVADHTGVIAATLGDVGGDVNIQNSEGDVDLVVEGDVGGDLMISDPSMSGRGRTVAAAGENHAVSVTLNGASVGGRVSLVGVAPTTLSIPGPFSIGDDLEADNIVQPSLDLSQVSVGGNIMLRTRDVASISITTAALDSRVIANQTTDALDLTIPTGAVTMGTPFTIDRMGGAEIEWQVGLKPDGSAGLLDPYSMFAIEVGNSLGAPATMALRLALTDLAPSELARITTAIADGRFTLARRPTNAVLASLPICPTSQPEVGCAAIIPLDANDQPTTLEVATSLKLTTLAAEFSDWALVIVAAQGEIPAASSWGLIVLALLLMTWGTLVCMRRSADPAQFA